MMIVVPNSCSRKWKKGEVKGEYGGVCGEEEGTFLALLIIFVDHYVYHICLSR